MQNRPRILRDFSGIGQGQSEYSHPHRHRDGCLSRWVVDLDEPMP